MPATRRRLAPGPTARCPECDRTLCADKARWKSCDRQCYPCGRWTGSTLVDICWACWFRERDEAGHAPAAEALGQ